MPAAGLYHVRHRWYDSENGDWLSPNPLSYVDGLNLLQCARSSPVNRTDPAGEIAPLVILGIIATIAALDELAHAPTLDDTTEVRRALEEERDQEQMIELIMIPAGGAIGLGIGSVGS
jgi:uncharacterized protein RhaS with RHS repeats